jgi:PAS domain S-box-containing protein
VALVVGSASVRRRRAEHEVERIFDLSLDLLGIATSEGVFTHVNPAFTRTLGYSAEELTSRPLLDFAHPDDRWRSHQALERLARGEELGRFENRYLRKDGSVCWLEWNVHPIPEANRLYAAARDITARRDAEEQVRQAQEVLRSSRDELRRLADEHAAVRRVATLVARGVSSEDVFAAVAHEVRELLGADGARLSRYGPDRTATVVAADGEQDLVASAAASIVVEGTTWGHIEVGWRHEREVSSSTAERMRQFTELVATAIANAHSRAELTASRARVVAAADAERRRIERDLHDGTQQRLLALALALRLAQAEVPEDAEHLNEQIGGVLEELGAAVANLQELSRGIHPAILSRGGLAPAMAALANRSRLPVELETDVSGRLDERIEVAAYYLVSEALTNAAKHASATRVEVRVGLRDSELEVVVSDDGVGGADSSGGTGLLGLLDRVHALGGVLEIDSPRGQGTTLRARLPLTAPTVVVADPAPGGPVRDPTAQLT